MLKFNTQAMKRNRLLLHERFFKAIPPLPNGLKTSFLAALLCCLLTPNLYSQCDIGYAGPSAFSLSLDASGTAAINSTLFVPFVTSSFSQCLPQNGADLDLWMNSGATIAFPNPSFYDCLDIGTVVPVWVTLDDQGPGSQSAAIMFTVTITDDLDPLVIVPATINMDADPGACSVLVDPLAPTVTENCPTNLNVTWVRLPGGSTSGSGIGSAAGIYNVGTTLVEFTVTDGTNTVVDTTTVTISDTEAPVITGCPTSDVTANNDPGVCGATVAAPSLSVNDNCPGSSISLISPLIWPATFPVGTTTVTYRATDGTNTTDCVFDVVITDNEDPVFGNMPASQTYSPSGCAQNLTFDVGTVTDNCVTLPATVDVEYEVDSAGVTIHSGMGDSFTYDFYIGVKTVIFTATDPNGNDSVHSFTVTVEDNQNPIAVCQDLTVSLDASGQYVLNAIELEDGSTDNCDDNLDFQIRYVPPHPYGITNPWRDTIEFECADIGSTYDVRFRAIDDAGNNSPVCVAQVTIEDNMPPVAVCADITVDLADMAPTDTAYVFADDIIILDNGINNGSNDNCTAPADLILRIRRGNTGPFAAVGDSVIFTCDDLVTNPNLVEVRVRDAEGNINFCSANVTVEESEIPIAVPMDITVSLSATNPGSVTVDAETDLDDASSDNCGVDEYLIAKDNPLIGGLQPGTFAATASFDCDEIGANTVWLKVEDASGNESTAVMATVTVEDVTAPTAMCKPTYTAYLDASGNLTLAPSDIDNGSTDNCDFTLSLDITDFDCGDIVSNPTTVTLTIDEDNGALSDMCTTDVTIVDDVPPVASCTDAAVSLQSDGMVTVFPLQFSLTSFDACCGFALDREISLDGTTYADDLTFDCDDIGDNMVYIRLIEDCGFDPEVDTSVCSITITVEDNESPLLVCPDDITVECTDPDPMNQDLSPAITGDVTEVFATPVTMPGTAYDNCDVDITYTTSTPTMALNCQVSGWVYYVDRTWSAEDEDGNTAVCSQRIYVEDTTVPSFTAPADADVACEDGSLDVVNHTCGDWASTDVPLNINFIGTDFDISELTITDEGKITDLNVIDLKVEHSWTGDLLVELRSPSGTTVTLFDRECSSDDNLEINFDDESGNAYGSIPCPATDNGFYETDGNVLSNFIGEEINGTWQLRVTDFATADGGNVISWGIDACYVTPSSMASLAGITGDVTDEDDNCDLPEATYKDYHAFKGFAIDTANAPGGLEIYDFSIPEWDIDEPLLVDATDAPESVELDADASSDDLHTFSYDNVPEDGWIIFDYMSTMDVNDTLKYFVNSDSTILDMTATSVRVVVPISSGDDFGFSQESDGTTPHRNSVIKNFVYVDAAICPAPAIDCPREFCMARIWDLKDACGNEALTQAQVITTSDDLAPTTAFPNTMTVLAQPGICAPLVNLDLSAEFTEGCDGDIEITNNADVLYGKGDGLADASGTYMPGTYTITFMAEDDCGNINTHVVELTVEDDQDPVAKCTAGINVQLDNTGQAILTTADVDNNSSDNCGIVSMELSALSHPTGPSLTFDIDDIGDVAVTLTVYDAANNDNSCMTMVTVIGGVRFDADEITSPTGLMATIPVVVNDFEDIISFQMDFEITDGTVAEFLGASTPSGSPLGGFLPVVVSADLLTVSWFGSATDIPDGDVAFNIQVMVNGPLGSSTPITIDNDEVGKLSGIVPSLGLSGSVTVVGAGSVTISGNLRHCSPTGDPVNFVDVEYGGGSPAPGNGSYTFTVSSGSDVTIEPMKDINWNNGVTTLEAACVHYFSAGLPMPAGCPTGGLDPYQLIAADVNMSNSLSAFDAALIQQIAVFNTPVAGNTSWRFVPELPALPADPFTAGFDEILEYTNVTASIADAHFIGIKTGDINCSASSTAFAPGGGNDDDRNADQPFSVNDTQVEEGETVSVAFSANDFSDVYSIQTTLNFDEKSLELTGTNGAGLASIIFNTDLVAEGKLALSWYSLQPMTLENGEELFMLEFTAQKAGLLSEMLYASSDLVVQEVAKANGSIMGVDLVFESLTSTGEAQNGHFSLYQNRPNPFGHTTNIGFTLPEASQATLTILDPAGRVLKVVDANFSAGYHQVAVNRDELPASGVLYYRLETPTNQAVKKMVLLD